MQRGTVRRVLGRERSVAALGSAHDLKPATRRARGVGASRATTRSAWPGVHRQADGRNKLLGGRMKVALHAGLACATACEPDPAREIRDCPVAGTTRVDCCTTDESCRVYYEGRLPYCRDPGPEGVCASCGAYESCDPGECCVDVGLGAYACVARDAC